jgi:hypothetical protein
MQGFWVNSQIDFQEIKFIIKLYFLRLEKHFSLKINISAKTKWKWTKNCCRQFTFWEINDFINVNKLFFAQKYFLHPEKKIHKT